MGNELVQPPDFQRVDAVCASCGRRSPASDTTIYLRTPDGRMWCPRCKPEIRPVKS